MILINKRLIYLSAISLSLITSLHASEKPKKDRNPYYSPYYKRKSLVQAATGSLLIFCGIPLIKEEKFLKIKDIGFPDKIMGRSAITAGLAVYIFTYLEYRRNREFMNQYLTK
jgi:hypothetical protein